MKKVQGKKKRDAAAKESETVVDDDREEATHDLLGTKDSDVIF